MSTPPAGRPPARSILHLVGLDPAGLRPHERTLVLLAAGLIALAIGSGLTDVTGTYGGIDVRNRCVGARVLTAGMDPYTFRWQPGMPDTLLDPRHPAEVPRVTVPPT